MAETNGTEQKKRGRPKGYQVTDEHKQALAEGRETSRAVRRYLEALEANKPKRGRPAPKKSPEDIEKRLGEIDGEVALASNPLTKLQLLAEAEHLRTELDSHEDTVDMEALERDFIEHARHYAERKNIPYGAWRGLGVPPKLLADAGIPKG